MGLSYGPWFLNPSQPLGPLQSIFTKEILILIFVHVVGTSYFILFRYIKNIHLSSLKTPLEKQILCLYFLIS